MKINNIQKYTIAAAIGLGIIMFPQLTPILMLGLLFAIIGLRIDERIPFIFSVVAIVIGAILLYLEKIQPANQFGNYAFYLFIIGFLNSFYVNYFKGQTKRG